jgi:sugar phosphate permease
MVTTPVRARVHWAWVIVGICLVNVFISYSVRLGYGVVLPEMITGLDLSRTAGGTIYNVYLLAYISITPLTGFLTDRLGGRLVITTCSLVLGLGVMLTGTAGSLWTAAAAFGIAGIGATGMWTPVITVVQRWFVPHRRGLALGILSTGYGLGFAAMGLAFPWIVSGFGWRYAWYFLGAAALAIAVGDGLLLRSDPESAGWFPWGQKEPQTPVHPRERPRPTHGMLRNVFRDRTFWLIGLSYFAISYALYGITTFMVDYATDQLGLPLERASLLATVHGVCQIAGVLTILPLSDRLGRRQTILISNTLITACLTGILIGGDATVVLFVLVGILAIFYGVTFPMYGACAGDYFPKEVMGTVIGTWTPFYGLGAILVHWVSGALRDTTGTYNLAFALNVVMAGVSIALIYCVRRARR